MNNYYKELLLRRILLIIIKNEQMPRLQCHSCVCALCTYDKEGPPRFSLCLNYYAPYGSFTLVFASDSY